ncbi:Hypothetical predicted protein, partial [Mytilus galloprovincialis]
LDSSNTSNDSIVSDLEYFNHELRGTHNSYKSYGGKSETKPKFCGSNSLDSGVFGSQKTNVNNSKCSYLSDIRFDRISI